MKISKLIINSRFIVYIQLLLLALPTILFATNTKTYVTTQKSKNSFSLINNGNSAPILISSSDYIGVKKVANWLRDDIRKVSAIKTDIYIDQIPASKEIVIVGTIGKSEIIDRLISEEKINLDDTKNKWEKFIIETVDNPFPNVEKALVIAGSDKRGAIYGMLELSKQIGVSPWYWWADVPVMKKDNIFINSGRYSNGEPKVKYRGIFINDEAPALFNWAKEKFGGFNHKFYEKVFELILRNNGNYLWPAMWPPTSFFDDDPENMKLADELGIVMATSHHEPMMRAHEDWSRFGEGKWNYNTNKEKLQEFWRGGIERNGNNESVVTVGMRGDGDEAMSEETATDLLQTIISDQRKIISDVTGKPAEEIPQVWAVYKEVQDYYDKGMRVPDDITILFCDDNWGNIRILPKKEDLKRKGGFGIYYHFDFVGGPTSYRWLNVTQIERVWEQMNLAYEHGVNDLWLVNVGDIKPMELPISFFLDFAWNPDAISASDLPDYYYNWAKQQFGEKYASEIAEILSLYTKYNARRTPEMLRPNTYSLDNYRESETIVNDYNRLLENSKEIYSNLEESQKSSFYQLVLSPVEFCSNLNEMYVAAAKNKKHAEQGRASTNYYAEKVKELFNKDAKLTSYFHEELENGKWNHMMSQTHIGYTTWNHPPVNKMPAISLLQTNKNAELGYVIENGSNSTWNIFNSGGDGIYNKEFSQFDPLNNQNYFIEIFNKGSELLTYLIEAKEEWIKLSSEKGSIKFDEKVFVTIDWDKAPTGHSYGEIIISGAGQKYTVKVPIRNILYDAHGFVENNGVISIEAAHFSNVVNSEDISWTVVPNLGRTNSSVIAKPTNSDPQIPSNNSPRIEYTFTTFNETNLKLYTYVSPTLNFKKNDGLKFAIAIDDEEPQIININEGELQPDWEYPDWWNNSVTDHIKKKRSIHEKVKSGKHILKVWMVDPGIVFQKFVIDAGGLEPSYLGPPESINTITNKK